MRKWNDKPPEQMRELNKATYIFLGVVNAFTISYCIMTWQIYPMQVFGIVTSAILVYLIATGKFYSIMRWYIERQTRKRDNKWR